MDTGTLPSGQLGLNTAHLCVDMQNLFDEGGPWATPWMKRVLPNVQRLVERDPRRTVFTRFIPPQRAADAPGRWRQYYQRWRQCTRENLAPEMIELLPALSRYAPPAAVIDKPFYSPFYQSPLDRLLGDRSIDTLVISGAETDVCVLAAVMDAVDRGYRVVLPQDAICSSSDATHDALVTLYHRRYGQQIEIATTQAILEHWPAC